jgi:hypothetical protein
MGIDILEFYQDLDKIDTEVENDNDVFGFLKSQFDSYIKKVSLIYDFSYVPKIKGIVEIILNSIQYYYEGVPQKAYGELIKLFTHKRILEDIKINTFEELSSSHEYCQLYRARYAEDVKEFIDMFHNPFENRQLIPTERYSIPGFPCLYLSSSIYCCWLELSKPMYNKFYVSRFEADKRLKILDMAKLPQDISDNIFDLQRYLITYPIILACSIKVKERNRIFKSEYIIPQLILQATRQLDVIDGIRFYSSNLDKKIAQDNLFYINYVFPAKDVTRPIGGNTYSKFLIDNFKLTPPVNTASFQQLDALGRSAIKSIAMTKQLRLQNCSNDYIQNSHDSTLIEFAKGYYLQYRNYDFIELEKMLGYMPAERLMEMTKMGKGNQATYSQIQEYVREKFGNSIKSCWISDVKRQVGLPVRMANNRIDKTKRVYPCPDDKKILIVDALKHFGMI